MKRYGDNVPHKDDSEGQVEDDGNQYTRLLLGGCAARIGTFPAPARACSFNSYRFLGWIEKKLRENK